MLKVKLTDRVRNAIVKQRSTRQKRNIYIIIYIIIIIVIIIIVITIIIIIIITIWKGTNVNATVEYAPKTKGKQVRRISSVKDNRWIIRGTARQITKSLRSLG